MNKLCSLRRNQVRKILGNPGLDLKVRKKNPKEIKLIFTKHNIITKRIENIISY